MFEFSVSKDMIFFFVLFLTMIKGEFQHIFWHSNTFMSNIDC